jgi:hypothetical protein
VDLQADPVAQAAGVVMAEAEGASSC